MFNIKESELTKNGAGHTVKEITQQPELWQEMTTSILAEKESINLFIKSVFEKHQDVRVIFTGAGTSAFAGDILVQELRRITKGNIQFEAIATTDIVASPENFLFKDIPTMMVSFARSGNSPESVAAVTLGEQMVEDFYQVVITCNKEGQLAKQVKNDANALTILTPEAAHDQGFAMTSSFTCMVLAAYLVFSQEAFEETQWISCAKTFVNNVADQVDEILTFDFERIVYLGSGLLGELSHEASLKMLELSAGQVVSTYESSLGFRHGPKSILNDRSAVVLFLSNHPYTRKYDLDILRELADADSRVIVLTEKVDQEIQELSDWVIPVTSEEGVALDDFRLSFLYIIFAQVLALKKSLQLGIAPDNPSPDGKVNRVVKGVTIYDY